MEQVVPGSVDAVVIGGGPNGLAAGLRLAEAGWSVCVLEAGAEIGGACRTTEATLPGFRHDLGAAFFPLGVRSPVFVGRQLERHGLHFAHAPLAAAHSFADGGAGAIAPESAQTAAWIGELGAPGDRQAWEMLQERYDPLVAAVLEAQFARYPLGPLARIATLASPREVAERMRGLLGSAAGLARVLTSEKARAFLVAPAMHADLGPEAPGTATYALLLTLLGQTVGMPVVRGGAGALTAALASALRARGGAVVTGAPVTRVVVEGGRAVGVECAKGLVRARLAVLGAVDPRILVSLLKPEELPAGALAEVRGLRVGLGTYKVDWALAGETPWTAEHCRRAAVVHIGETVEEMSQAAWQATYGHLPDRPTLVLGQPCLADEGRAPRGHSVLWGYARVPTHLVGVKGKDGGWAEVGERFVDRIEERIEAHAPGFRSRVLARCVRTPFDLQRENASLVGGDLGNGSFAVDQQLLFRPGPSWWRWGSPVKGLYLAGAGAPPGAAVHGGVGDLAARQALADARRRALVSGMLGRRRLRDAALHDGAP